MSIGRLPFPINVRAVNCGARVRTSLVRPEGCRQARDERLRIRQIERRREARYVNQIAEAAQILVNRRAPVKSVYARAVVFAWVVFESREQRDQANAKIAADPRLGALLGDNPPFDMQRIAYGGFKVLVQG